MEDESQQAPSVPSFDVKYLSIDNALHQFKCDLSYGTAGGKVLSGAKLAGLSAANVGILAGKIGVAFLKQLPQQLEERAKK